MPDGLIVTRFFSCTMMSRSSLMSSPLMLLLSLLLLLFLSCCAQQTESSLSLVLEHSLDQGQTYLPRAKLELHSIRSGAFSVHEDVAMSVLAKELKSLCQEDNKLYLLRVKVDKSQFRTATRSCDLLLSDLRAKLQLHFDWQDKLVAINIFNEDDDVSNANQMLSVAVQSMENGPQADTASFIQRLEQEKLAKQRGETKDNRSFLAKYWMYIVPLGLYLVMSSLGADNQPQQPARR